MSKRQARLKEEEEAMRGVAKSRPLRSLCASTQTPHTPRVHESSSPVAHSTERPVALSLRDEGMLRSSDVSVNRASAHSTERPVAVSGESLKDLTLCHKPDDEVNKLLKQKKVIRTAC